MTSAPIPESGVSLTRIPFIFLMLLGLVVISPLPLGSVYQWSWAALSIALGILLFSWTVLVARKPVHQISAVSQFWFPGLLYLVVVIWVLLQSSDLTPTSWHHESWKQTADAFGLAIEGRITLNPHQTASGALKLLSYGIVFWLSAQYCTDHSRARFSVWVLGVAGVCYAIVGLATEMLGSDKVLWFDKTNNLGSVTGTFVNRNMYSFYAGLGLICTAALFFERCLAIYHIFVTTRHVSKRDTNLASLLLVAVMLCTVTIGLTQSKGGAVSSTLALTVLLLSIIYSSNSIRKRNLLSLTIISFSTAAFWFIIIGALGGRFKAQIFDLNRIECYTAALAAIEYSPLLGYGFGTFRDIFYLYNRGHVWSDCNYSHSHYLGAIAELGILAAAALMAVVLAIAFMCARDLKRRRSNHIFPSIGVATVTLVMVHGLVDAPLHIPANALTVSFLLGLSYAQSRPSIASGPICQARSNDH